MGLRFLKKYICVIVLFIIITLNFYVFTILHDTKPILAEETVFSNNEVMGIVTKRITYNRNNLRYSRQQEEFIGIQNKFKALQKDLDTVVTGLISEEKIGLMFNLCRLAAQTRSRDAKRTNTRYLMVLQNGKVSFLYTDPKSLLTVKRNKKLAKALKVLNNDIEYAVFYNDMVIFTLNGYYFAERERVELIYYLDETDLEYLSQGISQGNGWIIEIYGYNQNSRKYYPGVSFQQFPDIA